MNKLLTITLGVALSASVFAGNQAREVMEKVDARDDGDSMISTMQMTLIDKKGKKRSRQLRTYSKDIDTNTEHKTIFFYRPVMLKIRLFLTYDYSGDDKDDDQWMYLPAT